MKEELLPCPFCGAGGFISIWQGQEGKEYHAQCQECPASMIDSASEEDAIADWNRRAKPERKLTDAEIRELAHNHLNGTGDHCIINFARALLAAQPAADPLGEFAAKLAAIQQSLPAEMSKVLHDNLWELYARDEKAAQPAAATVPDSSIFKALVALRYAIDNFYEDEPEVDIACAEADKAIEEYRKAPPATQAQDDGEGEQV